LVPLICASVQPTLFPQLEMRCDSHHRCNAPFRVVTLKACLALAISSRFSFDHCGFSRGDQSFILISLIR
jgi:hypothetical protein